MDNLNFRLINFLYKSAIDIRHQAAVFSVSRWRTLTVLVMLPSYSQLLKVTEYHTILGNHCVSAMDEQRDGA